MSTWHRQQLCLAPLIGEPDVHALIYDLFQWGVRDELRVLIEMTFALVEAAAARRWAEQRGRIGLVTWCFEPDFRPASMDWPGSDQ